MSLPLKISVAPYCPLWPAYLVSSPTFSFADLKNKVKLLPFHNVIPPVLVFSLLLWQITTTLVAEGSTFIILQLQGSGVWRRSPWAKIKVLAGLCSLLEAQGENLFPCLLQFLESALIPWLIATSLHLQSQKCSISLTLPLTSQLLLSLLLPPSLTFKDPYWGHPDNPGSSPCFKVAWITTLILSWTLISPCHITKHIHGFWDIRRTWASLCGSLCQTLFPFIFMCL